jgi:hypothetical protein
MSDSIYKVIELVGTAQESAHCRDQQAGHDGRKREGFRLPGAGHTILQVRRLEAKPAGADAWGITPRDGRVGPSGRGRLVELRRPIPHA